MKRGPNGRPLAIVAMAVVGKVIEVDFGDLPPATCIKRTLVKGVIFPDGLALYEDGTALVGSFFT
jgi:hypothetical protein